MATFTDNQNKRWTIKLDAPLIRTVRQELDGLDLAGIDGVTYQRLVDDPCLLFDAIAIVCRQQAGDMTPAEFAERIVGDVIADATAALLAAVKDFCPTRRRELLTAVVDQHASVRELGISKALAKIGSPELQTKIEAAMEADMDAKIEQALLRLTP